MPSRLPNLYMQRAIDLAQQATGYTSPNPLVGAVLVYQGRIIGEGYHHAAGKPHAEVNAFESVAPEDRIYISESTLYVTLEPCCHTGKTPPCTDRIIREGVKKVVVAMKDPFPAVGGKGIEKLQSAGISVEVGLLSREAERLNPFFLTQVRKGRPYITLKWAESADGYIDGVRQSPCSLPTLFSNDLRLRSTHRMRHLHDAILVGAHTALCDNPSLTNRYWSGTSPIRIVWDSRESIFKDASVCRQLLAESEIPLWLISPTLLDLTLPSHARNFVIPRNEHFLSNFLALLSERKINSLLVEGGAEVLRTFLDAHLYDAIEREVAPSMLYGGTSAPISEESL